MIKKKNRRFIVILLILVCTVVGYAFLRTSLTINGQTTVAKNTWSVKFTEITPIKNDGIITTEPVVTGDTTFRFGVKLNTPGDEYEVKIKIVNDGTIDAMVSGTPTLSGLEDMESYLDYSVIYNDGVDIESGNLLAAGKNDTIRVKLKFKTDISNEELENIKTLNTNKIMTFTILYIQADKTAAERDYMLCTRATDLHTEVCDRTSKGCINGGYTQGENIIYGHTDGIELTSGYALDCDLNGNREVDLDENGKSTERFYYVSDLYTGTENEIDNFDDNYAVLIYYNNIGRKQYYLNGNYEESDCSYGSEPWHGPNLKTILPTNQVWTNNQLNLHNNQRTIVNEYGVGMTQTKEIENPYTYINSVSRLLTLQEVNKACDRKITTYTIGILDHCNYLLENTGYAKAYEDSSIKDRYWLETPYSRSDKSVWIVGGEFRYLNYAGSGCTSFVRPAIEVPKAKISLK